MGNIDKLKNLILYVLSSEHYKNEGIKKLNKILYFIDFYFYRDHERFISKNIQYAKAGRGPIIDKYKEIFLQLEIDGILEKGSSTNPIYYKPKKVADLSVFSPIEIEHIHQILYRYGNLSSAELESISHEQQPWVLTEQNGEIIDPELSLLIEDTEANDETKVKDKVLEKELITLANKV